MIYIIDNLNTKVKAAQSAFSNFVDGKRQKISDIVKNTILVNNPEQNKKSTIIEIDSDCQTNAKGRLALLNPTCPIHGTRYIEDGLSLRKAKRRLKNTFGLEIYISRLWYLIQSTGIKSKGNGLLFEIENLLRHLI